MRVCACVWRVRVRAGSGAGRRSEPPRGGGALGRDGVRPGARSKLPSDRAASRPGKLHAAGQAIMEGQRSPLRQQSLRESSTDSFGSIQSARSPTCVDTRQITLNSAPEITLEKAIYTNLGRTKKLSLGVLRMQENKHKTEGIMSALQSEHTPRFAREEKVARENKAKRRQPHIEVMEMEGSTLLGVPGTSRLSQHSTVADRGRMKHILIAMHDAPRARGNSKAGLLAFCCMPVDAPCDPAACCQCPGMHPASV